MPEFLDSFSSLLDLSLNLLQLVALVISIATFLFFMFNQYSKALKHVLTPCGLGRWARLRVLFLCRKSPTKKRAFIEFAILKTQGSSIIAADWNTLINEFRAFYTEESALVYEIPNCTLLIGEELSDCAARYFSFFSAAEVRKAFGVQDAQLKWVIRIHVAEAYVTPTCLLTGLLSKYEENWTEFIKRYVSTAYISEAEDPSRCILPNELYFTFAWLLWGPSYEIDYRSYWAGLCQLSYGDESNSIPAIADRDTAVAGRLIDRFAENEGKRYGALVSADLSIYENKAFYRAVRAGVNPKNLYFYDKVEGGVHSFAVQLDAFSPQESYKAKKYYCTAYVWLLFELEDAADFRFRPEKSVAFFEHANLADRETYNFLVDMLIEKSIRHFTGVFSQPEHQGRRYRFVCAMNDEIAEQCRERYAQLLADEGEVGRLLGGKIEMEPRHAPSTAFAAFDRYFSRSNSLHFEEVSIDDRDSISDLGHFYTNIYMESFPDVDERETFDNLLVYLKNAAEAEAYRYHILLAKDEYGKIVGGGIFDYFPKPNAGVVEFIAVKSDSQSSGIGSAIYAQILAILEEDACRFQNRFLSYVFCEMDAPEHSKANTRKYLYFWSKHKYQRLDFSYIQPSLSPDKSPVTGLWFAVSPLRDGVCTSIPNELALDVIQAYMRHAMQIPVPEENESFLAMHGELTRNPEVPLINII